MARSGPSRARLVTIVLAACLAAAIAGCGAQSAVQPEPQLTGVQLAAVLLPQSYFPADYTLDHKNSANSGDALLTAPATASLATVDCPALYAAGPVKLGPTAYASSLRTRSSGSTAALDYGQAIL